MPIRRRLWIWGALDANDSRPRPPGERPDGYGGAAYNPPRPPARPLLMANGAWPVVINPTHPSD
jgi:hypothetical protein